MAARLNTRHVKPVVFPNFFGVKRKTSLKWETLTGEKGAPVMADVISFDASAPQKTRRYPEDSRQAWHERERLQRV